METTASGQVGVFAVRPVDAAWKRESESATTPYPPTAEKIATSRDWGLAKNELTALSDLVRVSYSLLLVSFGQNFKV